MPVTLAPDPPTTVVGESVTPATDAGLIVRAAVSETVASFAVSVAVAAVDTPDVGIVNVAEVEPAGTVTVVGGVALVLLDEIVTATPPVGAAPLSVSVPVELLPPTTVVGDTVKPVNVAAGLIVSVAVPEEEPKVAVIVAVV